MARVKTVAVLGAGGTMGLAMAGNLARAGLEVRAWNRSSEKARPLERDDAVLAGSPAQAARGAQVILTMLADADSVLAAMAAEDGALSGGTADEMIWLQMSTIGEAGTERCAELAAARGVTLVDAPVLGTKAPAQKGELVVLASGPARVRERLAPILDAVGSRTMWVGEVGAGSRLKLATNSWLLAVVEAAAESIALTESLDLDPALLLEALRGGPLDLPYLQMKGRAMVKRSFEPSFSLRLAAKDAGLVQESIDRHHLDLPMLGTIRRRFAGAVPEHGDQDLSAIYLASAPGRQD